MTAIQNAVVARFLRKPVGVVNARHDVHGNDSVVGTIAELLDVGEMDTRKGRLLFINVVVGGKTIKLFGSAERLRDAVSKAGFPDRAE